ncbi:MAG: adenylosuccinate synthase, partial [Euryarchaeota archaeon]|nr:adenylosuccinate synthase [Euryarchaeota archaeon]
DVSDEELKRMARETVKLGRKYREMIKDTEVWLNDAIRAGKKCAF